MNKFIYILLGGVIGASATYAYMSKKIKVAQKKAEEDIVEMRKYYNEKLDSEKPVSEVNTDEEPVILESETKKTEVKEYHKLVNSLGYQGSETNLRTEKNKDDENDGFDSDGNPLPYIITPDEFGDLPGYDTDEFTLYSDGVITDSEDEIVEHPEEIFGEGNLEEIGKHAPDILHIRNEKYETDYEIIRVLDNYSDR